ncbi:uncharacterized protein LOC129905250 [Episyrphus balteatus]|uniref:uncharacterized protein LOC129905250 n=1 Tax=Episyrphus balteatus TaxID=286459 RepID=UPI002486CB75|nr:uncharacterized protein LOC129905250 [Episyrphus balteatus]
MSYFENAVRPLREGENILDAGWIHSLGTTKEKIVGYVFQASHVGERPHEVSIENINEESSKWKCGCSCKAGIGAKCKHIAACLISIQRNPYLHELSSTELQQKWGKVARDMVAGLGGVQVVDMCHVLKTVNTFDDVVTDDMAKKILAMGHEAFPNSEFGRMKRAYRSSSSANEPTVEEEDTGMDSFFEMIFTENENLKAFEFQMKNSIKNETYKILFETKIKKSKEEAIQICKKTLSQSSFEWLQERRLRITGSISYQLFTYSKNKNPDWPKKIASTYASSFKGNEATRYGQLSEKEAKEVYGKTYLIFDCGIFIPPTLPYLAFSPDGISYNGDE